MKATSAEKAVNSDVTRAPANAAAEWVAIDELKPWARNPRRNDSAVKAVADSIRRFGFSSPIVARRETKEIIAGHTRWKAAKLLRLASVPVRLLDISERDAHLLALADNKTGEIADWDDDEVAKLLSDYSFGDAMLAGWSGADLGKMAASIVGAPENLDSTRKLSDGLSYSIVVECVDEQQQAELLERFEADGLSCKPLVA